MAKLKVYGAYTHLSGVSEQVHAMVATTSLKKAAKYLNTTEARLRKYGYGVGTKYEKLALANPELLFFSPTVSGERRYLPFDLKTKVKKPIEPIKVEVDGIEHEVGVGRSIAVIHLPNGDKLDLTTSLLREGNISIIHHGADGMKSLATFAVATNHIEIGIIK